MDLLPLALSWTQVLLLALLAVVFRRPALDLAVWGSLYTGALAALGFGTPLSVILLASLDGVFTTVPLLLVIFAGILLSTLLTSTGSLIHIVEWPLRGIQGLYQRALLLTLGVANFMEGASVIAEPVVAPMLRVQGWPRACLWA